MLFRSSKVDRVDIRARAVSHLRNIDEDLAATVADGLGLDLPDAAKAAKPTLDLPTSSALSIVANGPANFAGRKMGLLLTDGSSAELFNALTKALEAEGAVWEVVAPKIGGVTLDDGTKVAAKQKIDGGPSVLFDAVAVLPSEEGAAMLAKDAASADTRIVHDFEPPLLIAGQAEPICRIGQSVLVQCAGKDGHAGDRQQRGQLGAQRK